MGKKLVGKNDLIMIGVLIAMTALLFLGLFVFKKEGKLVVVSVDSVEVASFSLDKDLVYEIEGYNGGRNTLVIEDGVAYVKDSTCPDHLCEYMGKINKVGQSVICLPNRVVVEIRGNNNSKEFDAVVG